MESRNNTFGATPNTTWQVLSDPGVGFFIPPYQRGYNWDKSHIDRLFEDVSHGLRLLLDSEDSITFLGTLIVIDRDKLPGVNQSALPGKVRLLIDGQQRLTTILLMNICLHDVIRIDGLRFKATEEPASEWLYRETIQVTAQLRKTFEEDMNWGDETFQWYPRIIRAYEDTWSRSKHEAKYKSPIAAFVHGYSDHIRGENKEKSYAGPVGDTGDNNHLLANYRAIRKKLRILAKGQDSDLEMPLLAKVSESRQFQEAILKAEFPDEACSILSNEDNDDFKKLIRLVLLANFLNVPC